MLNAPLPTKESGQRSLDLPSYLVRLIPSFSTPEWMLGEAWRAVVANQPVATLCRDTLLAYVNALDWKVQARDLLSRMSCLVILIITRGDLNMNLG